jgi:hypothetical protein
MNDRRSIAELSFDPFFEQKRRELHHTILRAEAPLAKAPFRAEAWVHFHDGAPNRMTRGIPAKRPTGTNVLYVTGRSHRRAGYAVGPSGRNSPALATPGMRPLEEAIRDQ